MQSLRRYSDLFALMISSIVYALMHVNPTDIFRSFVLSLCIGFFVLYTGSLWVGILSRCGLGIMILAQTILKNLMADDTYVIFFCLLGCLVVIAGIISFMQSV